MAEGTAGATGETSHARNALSLPEIADDFKDLVRQVTEEASVIIGIDELDKIAPAERAQAFLNDIKLIFGLPRCYFLIAISEDALASFERRGLPIRDAYDSALDEVVRFEPIKYKTAEELLRTRVIGLPTPFVGLAFCLAGGLARDMIRWTLAMVRLASEGGNGLSNVCKELLRDDMSHKLSASMTSLARDQAPTSTDATIVLDSLLTHPEAPSLLRQCHTHLSLKGELWCLAHRVDTDTVGAVPGRSEDAHRDLRDATLRAEATMLDLLGYFYFAATLLEVFTDDLTEVRFRELSEEGKEQKPAPLTSLARARHAFSVDPGLGMREVSDFRRGQGLSLLEDPAVSP